jgi:hypothetical protein
MWIGGLEPPWNDSADAKKSRQHRGLARCCRRATLEQENLVAVASRSKTVRLETVRLGQRTSDF